MAMMQERLPAAPEGLGSEGRRLWKRLNAAYAFSKGQLEVLKGLCETADRLVEVRAALKDEPLLVASKMGTRSNPLLAVERDLRATQLRFYRALGLHVD